jgi:hypothetical protein
MQFQGKGLKEVIKSFTDLTKELIGVCDRAVQGDATSFSMAADFKSLFYLQKK